MPYIDGFVIPVKTADKAAFTDHANRIDRFFFGYGATRVVECWGDDVPDGKVTDFKRSVAAEDGESVAFSWVEWPDKATRDTAHKQMEGNEAMMAEPMPFDGKRMIFGGFSPVVELRGHGALRYIDGFVIAVPTANKDKFIAHAQMSDNMFLEWGALRVVECWGDDVPTGKTTDFHRAVQAAEDETVVFSWIEWPDKAARDAAYAKMMDPNNKDPRMDPAKNPVPFDGKRMIYGGFTPIVELKGQ